MIRLVLVIAAVALLEIVPGRVNACDTSEPLSRAPDGGGALFVCPRPMAFPMPGGGSDAPGWLVLRDGMGWVRGIVSLGMARTVGDFAAEWDAGRVRIPLHADLARPGPVSGPVGFLADRVWRWRALLGLVPSDEEFR